MQRVEVSPQADRFTDDESDLTKETLTYYNPDRCSCHRCGKKIWAEKKVSSYCRGLTYVRDGERIDENIMIPVYLCSQCGKSDRPGGTANGDYYHAVLPDNLIPFTCFTLVFVLTVLDDYVKRTHTTAQICAHWQISVSTLYRWKKRYMEHYEAWTDSLNSIRRLKEDAMETIQDEAEAENEAIITSLKRVFHAAENLPHIFFSRFRFSFLQPNCLTHFRPLAVKRRT